jgi:hypothetical protein
MTISTMLDQWTFTVPHLVYPTPSNPVLRVRFYHCEIMREEPPRDSDKGPKEILQVTNLDGESVRYEIHEESKPIVRLVQQATERI